MSLVRFLVFVLFASLLGAQTAGELIVPASPAEVALERMAKDIRDKRQSIVDALQQSRYELDKENKPLIEQIHKLQDRMVQNQSRVQKRFNEIAKDKQRSALIDQAQIPWLSNEVRKSANLPADAQFDIDTGKWIKPKGDLYK